MPVNAQGYLVETDMTDWVYIPDDVVASLSRCVNLFPLEDYEGGFYRVIWNNLMGMHRVERGKMAKIWEHFYDTIDAQFVSSKESNDLVKIRGFFS